MTRIRLKVLPVVLISLIVPAFLLCAQGPADAKVSDHPPARVVAVHDGDTLSIMVGRKRERVRLIGIDAPELGQRPWGAKAKKHLEELVDRSERIVSFEPDVEKRDKYGRLLAYLWTADGKLINLEMLKDGYAVLFTCPPNVRHVKALREGQSYARERRLGIWGQGGLKDLPVVYRKMHPR